MKRILAIGAHPDDIEIGAGGTLARHVAEGYEVMFIVATRGEASGNPVLRNQEALMGANIIGAKKVVVMNFPDSGCHKFHTEMVKAIENEIKDFAPDRAYIHYDRESHGDHVALSRASLSALRNCPQILMYEGPSTYPDFTVDYWYDISGYIETKRSSILAHASQGSKEILKLDAIESLNKYRGYQCRKLSAEGFKIFRFFE
jgi:LmbE family N-acetylglucosaminyl deacetylase